MLILLPILLLLIASLAIFALRWLRPEFTYSWTIAAVAALVTWVGLILLRFRLGIEFAFPRWQPQAVFSVSPALLLDRASWPYALAVAGLVLAVILTASARAQYQSNASAWAGSLLIGSLGLVGVLAANPLTLVMAWVALDFTELLLLLGNVPNHELSQRSVLSFMARIAGILCVLWAMVYSRTLGKDLDFSTVSPEIGIFLLLAAGLRLGVLPLHLPFSTEPRLRRGLGTLLRLVPAATALMLLGRLSGAVVPERWTPILLILSAFAGLYGAVMWLKAEHELSGRPYWIISLAALAVVCVIRSDAAGSQAWGLALLLSGGILFLYSARDRQIGLAWILGLWGLTGLPYSPALTGWKGLWNGPLPGLDLFFSLTVSLLLIGYIRHALRPGDPLFTMQRWIQSIYPLGLMTLPVTQILLTFTNWIKPAEVDFWWAGGVVSCLAAAGILWIRQRSFPRLRARVVTPFQSLLRPLIDHVLEYLSTFLSLEWLYRLVWVLFRSVGRLLGVIRRIFEGDGGVLWALVLLTLLVSLIRAGGNP